MKRIAIVVAVVAGLTLSSVALAAGTLSGTYGTRLHTSAFGGHLNGRWTIAFTRGHYTVSQHGKAVVHGVDSISGRTISLTDKSGAEKCPGTGTYKVHRRGRTLTFTKIHDSAACAGRAAVLSGTFTKVR
jgi:hypothetical protein